MYIERRKHKLSYRDSSGRQFETTAWRDQKLMTNRRVQQRVLSQAVETAAAGEPFFVAACS